MHTIHSKMNIAEWNRWWLSFDYAKRAEACSKSQAHAPALSPEAVETRNRFMRAVGK